MYVDFTTTVNKFEVNKFFGTPQDMIPRGVIFFELKIKMITMYFKQILNQNRRHINLFVTDPVGVHRWIKLEVEVIFYYTLQIFILILVMFDFKIVFLLLIHRKAHFLSLTKYFEWQLNILVSPVSHFIPSLLQKIKYEVRTIKLYISVWVALCFAHTPGTV